MAVADDQQFCLRWNNFQANITSQFETLRDDEDFTDVTIACEGQRLQAHKVVLSACSPFFKELFKTNPCSHPIIFMRDVEARHVVALLEFMYAGEVNVAQAQLPTFLKTAESLKIRGLTDTKADIDNLKCKKEKDNEDDEDHIEADNDEDVAEDDLETLLLKKSKNSNNKFKNKQPFISSSSTVTSSQDVAISNLSKSPSPKRSKIDGDRLRNKDEENININPFTLQNNDKTIAIPKVELPDYLSDDDGRDNFFPVSDITELPGGMEIIPQLGNFNTKENSQDPGIQNSDTRKLHSLDPRPCEECGRVYSNLSNLRQHMKLIHYPTYVQCNICKKSFKTELYLRRHIHNSHDKSFSINCKIKNFPKKKRRSSDHWIPYETDNNTSSIRLRREGDKRNRLIKLGEGIEIYEDQLRSVKWSDYRKLTRGLATILFSPAELATCSVTGQRWSRAGSGERPVKPALDRSKVQAIISYVATRFPMVEISRIKQVLAYKCKENSTAFKMKAVRYYEEHNPK